MVIGVLGWMGSGPGPRPHAVDRRPPESNSRGTPRRRGKLVAAYAFLERLPGRRDRAPVDGKPGCARDGGCVSYAWRRALVAARDCSSGSSPPPGLASPSRPAPPLRSRRHGAFPRSRAPCRAGTLRRGALRGSTGQRALDARDRRQRGEPIPPAVSSRPRPPVRPRLPRAPTERTGLARACSSGPATKRRPRLPPPRDRADRE